MLAFCFILDKLLLKKNIPNPSVYAFYMALLSLGVLFLLPFGVRWLDWNFFFVSIIFGIIFIWGLVFFYKAVKVNEISRIAPLVGTITQIFTFLIAVLFFDKAINWHNYFGLFLLIIGGFLVSFDLPLKYKKLTKGLADSIAGGFLLAVAYSGFDYVYDLYEINYGASGSFINGFFWTRIGLFLGGLSLLIIGKYRTEIKKTIFGKKKKHQQSRNLKTISLFLLNKIFGGTSSILSNNAIYLGGAVFVQAMSSAQFVFVLILAAIMAAKHPDIFEEKLYFWDWAQKIMAIGMIVAGVVLVSV